MIAMQVKGLKEVFEKTRKINNRARKLNTPMSIIAAKAYKEVMNNFREQKSPTGIWEKWLFQGKRVSTRPTKRGGTKLLQDTGRLRGSIRFSAGVTSAKIYTNVKYAGVHQYGSAKKNIVARPFLKVSLKKIKEFSRFLERYLIRG